MTEKNIEKLREKIRSELENIAKASEAIKNIMKELPHTRGRAYRSLKPKSGEYIFHNDRIIQADFMDNRDILYEIEVRTYGDKK